MECRLCHQRGLVEPGQYQLELLAGIGIDVADRKDARGFVF